MLPRTIKVQTVRNTINLAPMKIAFCGPMGCGKTATAEAFVAYSENGLRLSLAYPLKQVAAGMAAVQGLDKPGRDQLQQLSAYRAADTWLNILGYVLQGRDDQDVFVDDMRFPDEAEYLREQGFFLVRLNVNKATLDERRLKRDGRLPTIEQLAHESEAHWTNLPADYEADGNLPLRTLRHSIASAWADWKGCRNG